MTRALIFIAALATATSAWGQQQPPCAARSAIVDRLNSRYGEQQQFFGMMDDGNVVELFGNPETGTWTALVSTPSGTSCIPATGTGFSVGQPIIPGEDM